MKRITILFTVVTLTCLSNGCSLGLTAKKYRAAQGPQGVIMRVDTTQGKFSGELIEVREAGIVMMADHKLRLLPYTEIVSSEADQTPSRYSISKRTVPKPDVQAHLRLLSRFPQGLTSELTQQLLIQNGQTELSGANP